MTLKNKNTIATSFTIDLSTIDKKIDKLVKYFHNCDIDLRSGGRRFVNPDVQYSFLKQSLENKKYKQSLSLKIDQIYFERFGLTAANLTERGIAKPDDFLIPGAFDDFGSRFDAFAATNTNPENMVLKLLNIKPYKYLKVDLLTKKEFQIYNENIKASYEHDRLVYLNEKLSIITSQFLSNNETTANYVKRINDEILTINVVKFPQNNVSTESSLEPILTTQTYGNDQRSSRDIVRDNAAEIAAARDRVNGVEEVLYIDDRDKTGTWDQTKKIWKTRVYDIKNEGLDSVEIARHFAIAEASKFVNGINQDPDKSIKKIIPPLPTRSNLVSFEIKGSDLIQLSERPPIPPPEPPLMSDDDFKDLLASSGQEQPEPLPTPEQSPISSKLQDLYPELKKAVDFSIPFSSPDFNFSSNVYALEELQKIEPSMHDELLKEPTKKYSSDILEKTKIKILNNIIKDVFNNKIQENQYKIENLIDYKSSYADYNFYEQKFTSNQNPELDLPEFQLAKKEELIFKLTYLREEAQNIIEDVKKTNDPLKIDFAISENLTINSAFANSSKKNNKFTAILDGYDLSIGTPVEFFEPTILSILSDIDFIDANLKELELAYCVPPESVAIGTKERYEEQRKNEVIKDVVSGKKNSIVETDPEIFYFFNFPDLYFIPNLYPEESEPIRTESFYESINTQLTRDGFEDQIKKYSKYYYTTQNDTPSAKLARDANMSVMMGDTLSKNGFYGLYEARKDSFSTQKYVQDIIDNINRQADKAGTQLESIIFAKTNISCLLKEFQTCFMPKIPSCKDVLRGFRFSELQNLLTKIAPESLYPVLYQSINQLRSDLVRSEREKELLAQIEELEEKIKNNKRKKLVFEKLDKRTDPDAALTQADIELGIGKKDLNLKKAYKNKLKQYKDFKLSNAIIEETLLSETQIAEDADKFLKVLEDNHIEIEKLCDLASLLADLSGISFTFGKLALPQLPEINLFQEIKLSLDLSIIQIILQAVVEFILKLLYELLSCGGLKNLVEAALTGNTEGMGLIATTAGALNQMARGEFDLDDFIDKNPQIDPRQVKNNIENSLKVLTGSLSSETKTQLDAKLDLGPSQLQVGGFSKEKTDILRSAKSVPETEQELYFSFTQLITELSSVLPKVEFVNLVGGNPSDKTLMATSYYIKKEKPELEFIAEPTRLRNVFKFIGKSSGLEEMKTELEAVATSYNVKLDTITTTVTYCGDEITKTRTVVTGSVTKTEADIKNILEPNSPKSPEKIYGDMIKDLLSVSPDSLKSLIDDKVIKPILLGKLPNGNKIKEVDRSQKKTIKRTLKPISDKFKQSSNNFYSNLPLMKKVKRDIPKYIIQKNEKGEEVTIDNPEFKDKINLGIGEKDGADNKEKITVEENKYVYGELFKEPFIQSSNTFDINSNQKKLKISIKGNRGNISTEISNYLSRFVGDTFDTWIATSEQTPEKTTIKLIENDDAERPNEVFSYSVSSSNMQQIMEANNLNNEYVNVLKNNLSVAINKDFTFDDSITQYLNNSYDKFLSYIYKKIVQKISEDSLLEEIDLSLLDTNTPSVELLLPLLNMPVSIPLGFNENPNIDTPLKYINFSPKQTEQQKINDIDPSLFGLKEISKMVSALMDKRNNELLDNFSDLEKLIQDKDNALDLSLIDGYYMGLIRTVCSELSLRSLFVLRTFKYDKSLLKDMLLSNFVSDILYKEITSFSKNTLKESIVSETKKHIDYLHNYIFENINSEEDLSFLFEEIEDLKDMNESLAEDGRIILSYKYDINRGVSDNQLIEKIDNLYDCFMKEKQQNEIKILKLQLRNLAYNELAVIFEKLSYITSTNPKTLDPLPEYCQQQDDSAEQDFLTKFLPNVLVNSELYSVISLNKLSDNSTLSKASYLKKQAAYKNNNVILESYIYVGEINKNTYRTAWEEQKNLNLYGVQPIHSVINFLKKDSIKNSIPQNKNISDMFAVFEYGMRMVYVIENQPSMQSSIPYDKEKNIYENFEQIIEQGKNKFYVSDILSYNIKSVRFANKNIPINLLEKTYAIPYIFKQSEEDELIGLLNVIPIFKEQTKIDINSFNLLETINELEDIKDKKGNVFLKTKINLLCNDKLKEFYNILSSNNLLPNLMILSSIGVLSNQPIKSLFSSVRKNILNDILISLNQLNNKNNFDEILEDLMDINVFKDFNAAEIIKTTLKAAVYVLQYYCQMTDPNISMALMLRNAVNIFLNLASQIPNPLGPTPKEIPPPLNALAIYSMIQRPINVFGIPPAGIGTGPPLTIPGMVLLAVEIILLASDISLTFDSNDGDDQVKELLKNYCINIHGYKKYGIE